MTPEAIRSKSGDNDMLPALPFDSWKDTLATLHMWSQIVGKVRLKGTFHQWFTSGHSFRRTLPTICDHICKVARVSFHESKGNGGKALSSLAMLRIASGVMATPL